jgi:cyclopropane-fatty-acyl-phospholipid synthase
MVFGRNMIPIEEVDRHAPKESDAWYLAMMQAAFPGSFLPFGQEQVVDCAAPHFRLVSSVSGRLDYIETIRQWDKRTEAWTPRLALLKLRLIPRWLTDSNFRFAFTSGESSNSMCFERELMDHYRLVFEKT